MRGYQWWELGQTTGDSLSVMMPMDRRRRDDPDRGRCNPWRDEINGIKWLLRIAVHKVSHRLVMSLEGALTKPLAGI